MHVNHPLIKTGTVAPRRYQEAIFSRALDANTLVVLPTGLGKTMIAAMVAAHRLQTHPESKVLFLAPTRPLALQHRKSFTELLNVAETTALTGMDCVEDRKKLWKDARIIFATPQTIENDILRGLSLKDVSLAVFDECHRSVGNYSYVMIAREYMKTAKDPLVLGLTASPSSDAATLDEIRRNLCIERVEARTEEDRDVREYVQEKEVKWVKVELPTEFKRVRSIIEELLRKELRELKERGYLGSASIEKTNKRDLLELQSRIRKDINEGQDAYTSASLAASAMKINHALELLETQGISALNSYLGRIQQQKSKAVKRLLADEQTQLLITLVHDLNAMKVDHPKLDELVKIIKKHEKEKTIVFTQYRDSVDRIIEKLNENDILAHEFIGQARRGNQKGMTQKKQVEVLDRFREGDYSVLVATSVAEEGLDIPAVDHVIFYEPIPSEIRSIQRRGRTGRSAAGNVYVLMAKGTRDEAYYWASYHKEKRMHRMVSDMKKDSPEREEGQKSISSFFERGGETEEKEVKIYVDAREKNSAVLETLRKKAAIDMRNLPVGDFIVSERVCIERKSVEDFLASMIDKRLFSQAADLARSFPVRVLAIEGQEDLYSQRNLHENAVRGAIASLIVDLGFSVVRTSDEKDTANLIYSLAKREQDEERKEYALRGEKKPASFEEKQRYVVESLPNVSAVLARRLLERFGSVQAVMSASKKELLSVEGIGESKADEIVSVSKGRYDSPRKPDK